MPKVSLNEKTLAAIKGTDKTVYYWDETLAGFGVMCCKNTKTYIVKERVNGQQVWFTFGRCNTFKSVKDARNAASDLLGKMKRGINPKTEKKEAIKAQEAEKGKGITLLEILNEYLEEKKNLKDSSKKFYRLCIDAYLSDWKNRPIREITESDVKARYKKLSQKVESPTLPTSDDQTQKSKRKPKRIRRGGEGIANGVMKTFRALCNHTINEYPEIMTSNPTARIKNWNKLKARENYIKPDQLPAWFSAVQASENVHIRDALLLCLFTGLRSKTEAFSLKWSDIDWTSRTITIKDTKNRNTFKFPMSSYVYDLLKFRSENYREKSDYVFPARVKKNADGTEKDIHISDVRKELDKISETSGVEITPHDCRRTFASIANMLNISGYTVKKLLNHSMGNEKDVTAGYIQVSQSDMLAATQKITNYILETVGVKKTTKTRTRDALKAYNKRFGELDTWGLIDVLTPDELNARIQRALEEGKPIDLEAEYGIEPLQEGEIA